MAASGYSLFVTCSLYFCFYAVAEHLVVTGKLTQLKGKRFGHSDVFGVLNLHASIADTAKKKNDNLVDADSFHIRSTQSKTYRLKKHNDVSSKSFHGFIPTSNHRTVRSKRGGGHTLPKIIHTTGKRNDNENVKPLRETSPSITEKETSDNNALHQGNQVNTAEGESKHKNSEIVPVGTGANKDDKNADTNRQYRENNIEKTILNETDGAKKTEFTNGSTTPASIGNGTTPKPEKCPNQTDSTELQIITKFSSQDSLWATLSLGILLFVLFCAVWYSKMWRRNSEFYEKYGTENDTDTSTEMAWSKHGHHTTVPLREIIRSKKEFFQKLQMKIKEKFKNNNEHKGSGRNHTVRYSKLQILPNDIDDGSDDEDVLFKRL